MVQMGAYVEFFCVFWDFFLCVYILNLLVQQLQVQSKPRLQSQVAILVISLSLVYLGTCFLSYLNLASFCSRCYGDGTLEKGERRHGVSAYPCCVGIFVSCRRIRIVSCPVFVSYCAGVSISYRVGIFVSCCVLYLYQYPSQPINIYHSKDSCIK